MARKGKKKAKKLKKLDKSEVEEMDQDSLQDVVNDYSLDVDLDDHSSLRKMVKAVVQALEEGEYLED